MIYIVVRWFYVTEYCTIVGTSSPDVECWGVRSSFEAKFCLHQPRVITFGQKNRASFAAMGLVEAFLELGLNIQGIDATYDDVDADLIRRFVKSKTIAPHPSTFLRHGNKAEHLVESFINDISTLLRPIVASTEIDINLSRRIIRLSKGKSSRHIHDPLPEDDAPSATDSTEATDDEFFDEDNAVDESMVLSGRSSSSSLPFPGYINATIDGQLRRLYRHPAHDKDSAIFDAIVKHNLDSCLASKPDI